MGYGLEWPYRTTPLQPPAAAVTSGAQGLRSKVQPAKDGPIHTAEGPMNGCDCGATPEEQAAGRHYNGCATHEGPADDPSDAYGQ